MRFLTDDDYEVQIRSEIAKIIDSTTGQSKLLKAENMAIAQIRNYISGRYDCDKIFTPLVEDNDTDTRDQFIVMLVIDLALYHLWSKEGTNNIPKVRAERYADALEWLKDVQKGLAANLPNIIETDESIKDNVRIWSVHTPIDNRF